MANKNSTPADQKIIHPTAPAGKIITHVRGRLPDSQPNPLDVYFGKRMRLRRTLLGMSQQEMARRIGVTFQQVQKYEKGVNRVGWSRACDIADVLQTPISYFREGMDDEILKQSPMRRVSPDDEFATLPPPVGDDPMKRQETLELVRAYYKIHNRKLARNIFQLLTDMSISNSNLPE